MGHRHFDSSTGRFLSRDPIGFDGGLNLYSYSSNSPVDLVDPEGLQTGMGSRADARWVKHTYPDIGSSSDPYGGMIGTLIFANATLALGPPAWRFWASSLAKNPVTTMALTEGVLATAVGYPGPSTGIPEMLPCPNHQSIIPYVKMQGAHVVNRGSFKGSGDVVSSIISEGALRVNDASNGRGVFFHPLLNSMVEGKPYVTFTTKVQIDELVTHRVRGAAYTGHYYQARVSGDLPVSNVKGFNHD